MNYQTYTFGCTLAVGFGCDRFTPGRLACVGFGFASGVGAEPLARQASMARRTPSISPVKETYFDANANRSPLMNHVPPGASRFGLAV